MPVDVSERSLSILHNTCETDRKVNGSCNVVPSKTESMNSIKSESVASLVHKVLLFVSIKNA